MGQQTLTTVKKDRSAGWKIILAVLLTLELITAVFLSVRLVDQASYATFRHNFIALLKGGTSKRVMARYEEPVPGQDIVRDENQVWTTETDFELFHMRYDNNGDLIYTAISSREDKILAPGTANELTFTVGNSSTERVDYSLTMSAWREGAKELMIPLLFKVYDDTGRYYVGSETAGAEASALNDVDLWESLLGGATRRYTIAWEWPFERGEGEALVEADAYDTALGNRAVTEDIIQHVTVRTYAEVYQVGEAERTWWGSSSWALVNLICMILTDIIAIVEMYKQRRERKDMEKAEEEAKKLPVPMTPEEAKTFQEEQEREEKRLRRKLYQILVLVFATVAFCVTENVRLPMILVDRWTLLMIVVLLIGITLALLTRKRDDDKKEKPEEKTAEETQT